MVGFWGAACPGGVWLQAIRGYYPVSLTIDPDKSSESVVALQPDMRLVACFRRFQVDDSGHAAHRAVFHIGLVFSPAFVDCDSPHSAAKRTGKLNPLHQAFALHNELICVNRTSKQGAFPGFWPFRFKAPASPALLLLRSKPFALRSSR